ncbi:2-dehydropantoate 2-reductase [Massariosphaeria phaeospora]|uniref:2-dehydropantoate 2-reductase n=1 Tax=Massariosphaeria phaeospora TaxID=100035 RepID=A0A7C8IF04_9PLEO|nr:2-dehydropantoate 2-reductase [Massariosphaeria phaeospora]
MASIDRPKILVFGVGGVGTIYLYLLSRVSSPTAVCRSNYEVVRNDGFIINSSIYGNGIRLKPNVVRDCAEATFRDSRPFDYILICSKAIGQDIPDLISPAVTPDHTVIVLIQNGIGIEAHYQATFPNNPIVSAVVYLPVTQRPAGVITHGELERLEIGSYPSSASSEHSEAFTQLIRHAGGTAEHHDDIQLKRWTKLLVNASWNPICALTLCTDANFLLSSPSSSELVSDVMLEICDIAKAHGYTIPKEILELQLGRATARIGNGNGVEPSMLQDVRAGRRMEVEAIVGNAVRMGREKDVKCEKLNMLYLLARALDSQIENKRRTS